MPKQPTDEDPVSEERPNGAIRETHPSFATASLSRVRGTPRTLFQSDLQHSETINLTIEEADRTRDLNRDWIHTNKKVVEVEMSLAQWGSLASSIGMGTGVPVTLKWRADTGKVPTLPFASRVQKNLDEVHDVISDMLGRARSSMTTLTEAIGQKKGVKAVREALAMHQRDLDSVEGNADFAINSLTSAAEDVVGQAHADIEAHILAASQRTGSQPFIQAQAMGQLPSADEDVLIKDEGSPKE